MVRMARLKTVLRKVLRIDSCPVCGFGGHFEPVPTATGPRRHALCPRCGSYERHRLQWQVLDRIQWKAPASDTSVLHVAPEALFRGRLSNLGVYQTTDLKEGPDIDIVADLCSFPMRDEAYTIIWASHVLEHIRDDRGAIREIVRMLKPGGFAILPVPIVVQETVEYQRACLAEHGHVRAPGSDYFSRYREVFKRVEVLDSGMFPRVTRTFVCEDRSMYPTETVPDRTPMPGFVHSDYVPICWK